MSDKSESKETNSADQPRRPGTDKSDTGPAAQREKLYDSVKGSSATSTEPSIVKAAATRTAGESPRSSPASTKSAPVTSTATAGASATAAGPSGADAAPVRSEHSSSGSGSAFSGSRAIWDRQAQETREELLEQFYSTLRVTYSVAKPDPGPGTRLGEQHRRIRDLLEDRRRTWLSAYEIEQLLVFVMSDDQLEAELPRRMAEAKAHNLEYVAELATQLEKVSAQQENATTDAERERYRLAKQYIFQRLLNDLQWFFTQRIRRRDAANRLTVRVSAMFLSAFLFFSTLLFIQFLSAERTRPDQSTNVPQQQTEPGALKSGEKSSVVDAQSGDNTTTTPGAPNSD